MPKYIINPRTPILTPRPMMTWQIANDANYADVLGRWLDYLQAGAPEAVVQAALTHCDELLPPGAKDKSVQALEEACAGPIRWVKENMRRHQSQLPQVINAYMPSPSPRWTPPLIDPP